MSAIKEEKVIKDLKKGNKETVKKEEIKKEETTKEIGEVEKPEEKKERMIKEANKARDEANKLKLEKEKEDYKKKINYSIEAMKHEEKVLVWIKRQGYNILKTISFKIPLDPFLKIIKESDKEMIEVKKYLICKKGAVLDREELYIEQLYNLYKCFKEQKL